MMARLPYVDWMEVVNESLSRFLVDVFGLSPLTRYEGRADIGLGASGGELMVSFRSHTELHRVVRFGVIHK